MVLLQRTNFGSALSAEQKDEKLREGRKAVEKALALDPNSARAHLVEGLLHRVLGDIAQSARANETAVALDRNLPMAQSNLGSALMFLGEPEKAVPWIEQALRLDPLGLHIGVVQMNLGRAYVLQRRSDLALE